jgi:hypothetical protein
MNLQRAVFLPLAFSSLLAACGDGDGPSGPETILGSIRGSVRVESSPTGGITVQLVGSASRSAITGTDGGYQFADVPAGAYAVALANLPQDVTFAEPAMSAEIQSAGQVVTVDFDGVWVRSSRIEGSVTVSAPAGGAPGLQGTAGQSSSGLAFIEVSAVGPETAHAETDADGAYLLEGLRAGTYEVSVSGFSSLLYTFGAPAVTVSVGVGATGVADFQGVEKEIFSGFGAPFVIDGIIDDNEWGAAVEVPVGLYLPSGDRVSGSLFLMNDLTNLYFAVSYPAVPQGDEVWGVHASFNNDYDSPDIASTVLGDDALSSYTAAHIPGDPHPWFWDMYQRESGGRSLDPSQDGEGATSAAGGQVAYELSHPLNSADDAVDFSLAPGDPVGFFFFATVQSGTYTYYSGVPSPYRYLPLRTAAGPTPDILSGSGTPSAIDGVLDPTEWQGATVVPITVELPSGASVAGTLSVMNDADNLYLGVSYPWAVQGDELGGITFRFNNDADSPQIEMTASGDDALGSTTGANYPGEAHPWFWDMHQNSPQEAASDASQDGEGAASTSGGMIVHELSHPLDSADDAEDFSLLAGDLVGFYLVTATTSGGNTNFSRFPDPSRYLTLKLSGG